MKSIELLNEEYQKSYKKRRLSVVTENNAEIAEILSGLVITDINARNLDVYYRIFFQYEGEEYEYVKTGFGIEIFNSNGRRDKLERKIISELKKILEDINLKEIIKEIEKEKLEMRYQEAKDAHLNLKIKEIKKNGEYFVYILENDDEIKLKVEV